MFRRYDEDFCILKTDIKVNGKHLLRTHIGLKSDLKGRLAKHGYFPANQEYSPDVKFDKEERVYPNKKYFSESLGFFRSKTKRLLENAQVYYKSIQKIGERKKQNHKACEH